MPLGHYNTDSVLFHFIFRAKKLLDKYIFLPSFSQSAYSNRTIMWASIVDDKPKWL